MNARRSAVDTVARLAHASGLLASLRRRRHRRRDYRVYILEYHDLCATRAEERESIVSAERLGDHLRFLAPHYRFATVAQAAEWLSHSDPPSLDQDVLVVTFDDGYRSNFELARPVLEALDVPGTVYLTTGFLDGTPLWFDVARRAFDALRGGEEALPASAQDVLRRALGAWPVGGGEVRRLKYAPPEARREAVHVLGSLDLDLPPAAQPMSWNEAQALIDLGWEMGAHTVTHPILSGLDAEQQKQEMQRSRSRIAEATGTEPLTFAFPNGSSRDYNAESLATLRDLGFRASCTTLRGSNVPGCDLMTLKRLGIGSDSNSLLAARLAGLFDEGLRRLLPQKTRIAPDH